MSKKPKKTNPKQLMIGTKSENDIQLKHNESQADNKYNQKKSSKKRFAYYRSEKEKQLFKRLTIIVGVLAIGVFITLYFISPFSKVGKIIVAGVQKSDGTSIVESSKLKINKGLWGQYAKKEELSNNIIKENPRIESAKIELKNLNTMHIEVKEYKTVAYVEKDNKAYEVLSNGKLVDQSVGEREDGLPLLINFEEGENLQEFIKTFNKIPSDIKNQIESIESIATKTNPFRIQLTMNDGNQVIGLSTTIGDKMVFYEKIAKEMEKIGIIDMEAGTTGVFSYPKDNEKKEETEDSETGELSEKNNENIQ